MLSIDPIVSKLFIDLYSLVMAFSRCSVNEREAGLVKKNFAAGRSTLPGQKERKKKESGQAVGQDYPAVASRSFSFSFYPRQSEPNYVINITNIFLSEKHLQCKR